MASVTKPSGVFILPETVRMTSTDVGGTLIEHTRAMGSDQVLYEWDWTSGTWKSHQQ